MVRERLPIERGLLLSDAGSGSCMAPQAAMRQYHALCTPRGVGGIRAEAREAPIECQPFSHFSPAENTASEVSRERPVSVGPSPHRTAPFPSIQLSRGNWP